MKLDNTLDNTLNAITNTSKIASGIGKLIPEPPEEIQNKIVLFFDLLKKSFPFIADIIHKMLGIFFALIYFLITCNQKQKNDKKMTKKKIKKKKTKTKKIKRI